MKPFSILLSLILGVSALSLVVWVGRYGGKTVPVQVGEKKADPSVEDLPMPERGPFGKAEVSELEFNFGVKNVGDEDQHTFTIKNVGEGPLEFKLGRPTCQCTIGEITREGGEVATEGPIAPGESIHILVKWVMKAKLERFRQSVPVFTTDPENRKVEFAIVGVVDQPLHLSPEGLWDLGSISTTGPSKAEGYIGSRVLGEFTLSEVPRENGRVKVILEPIDAEESKKHGYKSSCLVKIEVGPDIPLGQFRESIQLVAKTARGELTSGFIVGGRRTGPIEIKGVSGANYNSESGRLFLGEFPASAGKKAKITFMVKELDEDLVLKSVEPAESRVKFTFPETGKTFGKSKSYQVEVEIPPGPSARRRLEDAEVLDLKFNHPTAPDFSLIVDYNAI